MHLIISHIIPHPITSDDIRSYWNILAKRTSAFHFAGNAIDAFGEADRVVAGEAITLNLNFKKEKSFEIEVALSEIQKKGYILSLIFKEQERNTFLFQNDINKQFFPWVLSTMHLGGKMFSAEIAFLSLEEKPNSSVQLELNDSTFSIQEDPLIYWFSRMQIPNAFFLKIGFIKKILGDGSYYLLPEDIAKRFLSKKEKQNKLDLFSSLGNPYDRREIIRWMIHDWKEANEYIIETLRKGLRDEDWEVRLSSIIACAKMDVYSLIHDIRKTVLPKNTSSGLNKEELNILVGIKYVTIDILNRKAVPQVINKLPETAQEKKAYLINCILGEEINYFHNAFLLINALSLPVVSVDSPKEIPDCIFEKNGKYFLRKSKIEFLWIPPIPHWIGASDVQENPIRKIDIQKGFFISKKLIRKNNTTEIMKSNWQEANLFCEKIGEEENAQIELPSPELWEIAARGNNGRHYPWGLSYGKDVLEMEFPWLMEESVGQGGEWSNLKTIYGNIILLGNSKKMRCSELSHVDREKTHSFRLILKS